jgi:hypothetical protein
MAKPETRTVVLGGRDPDVYKTIQTAIERKEPTIVELEYPTLDQVPKNLRDAFSLDQLANESWVDGFTKRFVPGAVVPAKPDFRGLAAAGGAVAGGGAGVFLGGPVGAAVGALVGAGVGAIVAGSMQDKVRVHVEIDMRGKLVIKLDPK